VKRNYTFPVDQLARQTVLSMEAVATTGFLAWKARETNASSWNP